MVFHSQSITILIASLLQATSTELDLGSLGCEPLLYREGVRIKCTAAGHGSRVDCYDRSHLVPVGTVARYGCDAPFYFPVHSEAGVDRGRSLTCNEHGKWSGGLSRFHLYSCALNCGVPNLGSLTTFIQGGTITEQSEWPWHAIIFKRVRSSTERKYEYMCGGSLIRPHGAKEFVVVTAAHCMALGRDGIRNAKDLIVVLGAEESRLEDIEGHSPDAQVLHVKQVVLHNSYDGGRSVYQADIALLRLREPVRIKTNILPVCMGKPGSAPSVGQAGHIAGFGLYDKAVRTHSVVLRRASFPVADPDECSDWQSRKLNPQEFCAGTANQQNACNGDSGGGMVFNGTDEYGRGRFYLHGIVSHGKGSWGKVAACDAHTVYTRVTSFVDWIYDVVDRFEEESEVKVEELIDIGPTTVTAVTELTTTTAPTTPMSRRLTSPVPKSEVRVAAPIVSNKKTTSTPTTTTTQKTTIATTSMPVAVTTATTTARQATTVTTRAGTRTSRRRKPKEEPLALVGVQMGPGGEIQFNFSDSRRASTPASNISTSTPSAAATGAGAVQRHVVPRRPPMPYQPTWDDPGPAPPQRRPIYDW